MSADKPPGSGDHRPDQTPRPGHKPFPGAPGDRSPEPPPAGTKTADELRADRAKYKTTSEYNAAKAAGKAAAQQAGTGDSAPARGDAGGQRPAGTQDRGPAQRPDASGAPGPEGLARPDRARLRPFPGAPDNRPPVPPPVGTRTADELRADRARYKTTSEYTAAKAAEKAAARQGAAKETTTAKDAPAKSAVGPTPERAASPRDQGRTGNGQQRENAPNTRETTNPATEKTNEVRGAPVKPREQAPPPAEAAASSPDTPRTADSTHPASRPGSDHHPAPPAQYEGASTADRASTTGTGQAQDADPAARPDESAPQRQKDDGPQRQKDDGPPAEETFGPHLSWTTLPPEARTIGDTAPTGIGRKPDGEKLLEPGENISRADAFRRKSYEAETIEDVNDIVHEDVDLIDKLFDRPPMSSRVDVPVHHPLYEPAETDHASTTDIVMASLVGSVIAVEAGRAIGRGVHNLKEMTHEMIERHRHAGD